MLKLITSNLLLLGMLVGCAKEKSYDTVYKKPELLSKSDFQVTETVTQKNGSKVQVPVKYMYVPMTMGTPREVKAANPFYQGDEKLVRLEWAKDGLRVLEMEKDSRFSDNDLNDTPVLTIPGDFKKFKCKEDEFGDCTGEEEEDKELVESEKTHFLPKYSEITVEEVNMLELANVEGEACVTKIGTKLVDYEVSPGVINVELENTYKLNSKSFECIWENYVDDKLSYNSFKVRFFYSMVRLDQLATPGYKAIDYPVQDQDIFGFFKTKQTRLGDNFDPRRTTDNFFVNRWSPKRKNNELVYHLSKTFNKPKNKVFLDATIKATKILNKGLVKAGSPFTVKLVKQSGDAKAISPGDLRYNSVVLIDDPLANGLLGYGPSVKNPYTGEIIQAHTNMYGGVLNTTVRRVYEAAVDLTIERAKGETAQNLLPLFSIAEGAYGNDLPTSFLNKMITDANSSLVPAEEVSARTEKRNVREHSLINLKKPIGQLLKKINLKEITAGTKNKIQEKFDFRKEYVRLSQGKFEGMNKLEIEAYKSESKKLGHNHSRDCHPEFFPIGGTSKAIYPGLFKITGALKEDGTLKRWSDLNKFQKNKASNVILTASYVSTFIHEIGHNLGLRHNFQGSWDKENFYTDAEAKSLGMEKAPAYSSVMDYSFSNYNELQALGKYDIAALKFAYARKVEDVIEGDVSIDGPIHEMGGALKEYEFCTDENAGLSAFCNRFDEGTTLVEIAKFRAKRYENAYQYRNFRDELKEFSAYSMMGYLSQRDREFKTMRMIFEEYERFFDLFGRAVMSQGCSPEEMAQFPVCKMIKDRIDAVKIVGDFFVKILKTPDHICAVAKADKPMVITEFKKLAEIYDGIKYSLDGVTKSCFDKAIVETLSADGLIVVGQNGKFLNSFRDANPNYKYSTDRAVLGTWGDKVLAMNYLYLRRGTSRTTDKNFMALVDVPYIQNEVGNILAHYVEGESLNKPIPFKTAKGELFSVPYIIGKSYHVEQLEDVFQDVKAFLGLSRNGRSNLVKATLGQISNIGIQYGIDTEEQAYSITNYVTVKKFKNVTEDSVRSGLKFDDRRHYYEASTDNVIAAKFISAINLSEASADEKKIVAKVLKLRTAPEAPESFTIGEKAFFNITNAGLQNQLIDLKTAGATVPLQAFVGAFGAEQGSLIFALYQLDESAKKMVEIVELKEAMMTIPSEGASQFERQCYKFSVQAMQDLIDDKLSEEIIDYYKNQLKLLPQHKYIED